MTISVIIADDHKIIRDGLRLILESTGNIEVVGEAANGREVLEQVHQHNPQVILMDISMPELNGIDATYLLQRDSPLIQVIILSVYATTEHIFRALRAGAKGYLLKESAGSEVVSAIYAVNTGQRYLSLKITEKVLDDYIFQRNNAQLRSPLESLSAREREVIQLVAEGRSSAEIAELLSLSPSTVETYRSRLMSKLKLNDLAALIKFAYQHGLIHLD